MRTILELEHVRVRHIFEHCSLGDHYKETYSVVILPLSFLYSKPFQEPRKLGMGPPWPAVSEPQPLPAKGWRHQRRARAPHHFSKHHSQSQLPDRSWWGMNPAHFLALTVCPKLFGTQKMYQNGPQMSNYCAQLPPHARFIIHGIPKTQKSPYGNTQGPKFIVFRNARIQTIFEDVKKTYFKFNQITMRPAYNDGELFFEQNK